MKFYLAILTLCLITSVTEAQQKTKTENVILITLDGMRWQEVFNGADSSFMRQQQHLKDGNLKAKFWRDDLNERRKALFPFFWNTIATQGQLYGNRAIGSKVDITNNQLFSYPGYNEILTGRADNERIHSNDKFYNPNKNVLEYFNSLPAFKNKVAAFTSWDVFPYIINDKRSGVYVSTGWQPVKDKKLTDLEQMMNQLTQSLPNPLGDVRLDGFTFYYGMEYMKKNKPRVMFFAFDETDDFAHGGEYAAYLNSAHYTDRFISELWQYIQSDPTYKNKTTIIITCDHGRGADEEGWKHHGQKVLEATQIWLALLGPDTPALGEIKTGQAYQNQIAKTMAALLGLNYTSEQPVGEVLTDVIKR